jgi:hypothetical protein
MSKLFRFCFLLFVLWWIGAPAVFAQSYDRHFRAGDGSFDFNLLQGSMVFQGLDPNGHDSLTVKWLYDSSKSQRTVQTKKFLMQSIDTIVFGGPADSVSVRIVPKGSSNSTVFTLGSSDSSFAGVDSIILPAINSEGGVSLLPSPQAGVILQCFPNPAQDNVVIEITVDNSKSLHLTLFDEKGTLVRDMGSQEFEAGTHSLLCPLRDDENRPLPDGTYLFTVQSKEGFTSLKLSHKQ